MGECRNRKNNTQTTPYTPYSYTYTTYYTYHYYSARFRSRLPEMRVFWAGDCSAFVLKIFGN